jgi:hypothetical protein
MIWFLNNIFHCTNLTITAIQDITYQAQSLAFQTLDICRINKDV